MGVFSGIRAGQFPATHPRMFWFLILTELSEGEHTLKISMGLPAEEPVLTAERSFQAQNPLQRVHLVNEIKNARFERPDNYAVTIEVDNDPILVTNFPVSQ
jgi:hypothetical protein